MSKRYLLRKFLHLLAVLVLVTFATMALLDLTPGGPAYAILGDSATPEQVEEVNQQLGLDRPIVTRYGEWLGGAVSGDLGESVISRRPIGEMIRQRLPVTLEIVALGLTLALVLAVVLAALSAYRPGKALDRIASAVSSILISSPVFLTALLLVYVFAITFEVFPVTDWRPLSDGIGANLRYAALPAITLALVEMPVFLRVLRADLVGTLQEDFIVSARAKGLSTRRILLVHAVRPSSFSLITLAGLSLGSLIGGAIIVESMFAIPGIGQMLVQGISGKDLPTVQGVVLVVAVFYVVINALIDVAYCYLDPRVRAAKG